MARWSRNGRLKITRSAAASHDPSAGPLVAMIRIPAVYPGWRMKAYGPVVTTCWPRSVWMRMTEEKNRFSRGTVGDGGEQANNIKPAEQDIAQRQTATAWSSH